MIVETIQYKKGMGWSMPTLPDLDSENTLVLVFSSPELFADDAPIQTLLAQYSKSKIMGCSTAGEIFGATVYDDTLSVAVIQFKQTRLKLASVTIHNSHTPFDAGKSLVSALDAEDLAGIFVLSDGLINGSELTKGLNSLQKRDLVITGGLAGDGARFEKTWVIENGVVQKDRVIAVGFYGKHIRIGHGSKGGWDIFGVERRITRSKNNILYELDGKSALSLYKTYLGDKAAGLPATGLLFPLSIRKNMDDPTQLVRTILAVDEKEGSLTFAGDVPMGYLAQLMRANFDRLITGATQAGELVLNNYPEINAVSSDILLIAVSCVGRRLLLGERINEETESVLNLFPKKTKMIGFYSYGELSPYAKGSCDLHNQTMTLTSLYEVN